jgi:hypothetical protein
MFGIQAFGMRQGEKRPILDNASKEAQLAFGGDTRARLAIIVPCMGCEKQIQRFYDHISVYLEKHAIDYHIFVVTQIDSNGFNRGAVINAGVHMLQNQRFDYICMHDIDRWPTAELSPEWYQIPEKGVASHPHFEPVAGAILLLRTADYISAGGFSNHFWGWGWEDNDLAERMSHVGIHIKTLPDSIRNQLVHNNDGKWQGSNHQRADVNYLLFALHNQHGMEKIKAIDGMATIGSMYQMMNVSEFNSKTSVVDIAISNKLRLNFTSHFQTLWDTVGIRNLVREQYLFRDAPLNMIPGYEGLKVCAFLLLKCIRAKRETETFNTLKAAYANAREAHVIEEKSAGWDDMALVNFTINQPGVFEVYEKKLRSVLRLAQKDLDGVKMKQALVAEEGRL